MLNLMLEATREPSMVFSFIPTYNDGEGYMHTIFHFMWDEDKIPKSSLNLMTHYFYFYFFTENDKLTTDKVVSYEFGGVVR